MTSMVYKYTEEKFIKVAPGRPCPICSHDDWCGFNSIICSCMRVEEGSFKTVMQRNGMPAYLHWLMPGSVNYTTVNDVSNAVKAAPVVIRDRVYGEFLSFLTLHERHKKDLLHRGLTEWDIKKNGYKSIPERPWDICKRMQERGRNLIGIPGFYMVPGRNGVSYWTFRRQPGYFIPVLNANGRIQALQGRMDNPGMGGKYKIFSSASRDSGCSSGTPAHVARPKEIKDRRVWITEGPLKADIACNYLGAIVVAAMGAGNWVPVVKTVEELNSEEVVLAYDRDFQTNALVREAYQRLKNAFTYQNLKIYQATWDDVKGIDDALVAGKKITVSGGR